MTGPDLNFRIKQEEVKSQESQIQSTSTHPKSAPYMTVFSGVELY